MRHARTVMIGRDGSPIGARRRLGDPVAGPITEPIRFRPPDEIVGEDWQERLANYREMLKKRHGLDMSRD